MNLLANWIAANARTTCSKVSIPIFGAYQNEYWVKYSTSVSKLVMNEISEHDFISTEEQFHMFI